jgi:hypothetical protein
MYAAHHLRSWFLCKRRPRKFFGSNVIQRKSLQFLENFIITISYLFSSGSCRLLYQTRWRTTWLFSQRQLLTALKRPSVTVSNVLRGSTNRLKGKQAKTWLLEDKYLRIRLPSCFVFRKSRHVHYLLLFNLLSLIWIVNNKKGKTTYRFGNIFQSIYLFDKISLSYCCLKIPRNN